MNNLTRFLLDLFLIKNVSKFVQAQSQKVQEGLKQVRPFSWQAALLLSLFSWFVYLLLQDFYAKKFVSVFAWGFLIIGVDWALLNQKVTIPLIGFKFQPAPWITGAIACLAFASNDFLINTWREGLISWPIFSAVFAGYAKFLQPGLILRAPSPEGRQELVILFLLAGLFSCWFQFHFVIQDLLRLYPNLLADTFDRSAFMTRIEPDRPTTQGFALVETAEQKVQKALTGKNWIEVQRWFRNLKNAESNQSDEAKLSREIVDQVYPDRLSREQELWQITIDPLFNPAQINLDLRATWQGASSIAGGYTIIKSCQVSETALPIPKTFEEMQTQEQLGGSYQFTCDKAKQEQKATQTPEPAQQSEPSQQPEPAQS